MVIPCDVCGKEFKDRWKVNRHMRVHTGDKPPKKQPAQTANNGQYERGYLLPTHTPKAQERVAAPVVATAATMASVDANKTTGYEVFVQKCFSQHKFQNPEKVKDVEEFNKQCSVWWYNLSDQDRQRFEETANQINQQQQAPQPTYTLSNGILQQTATTSNTGEQMATFSYDYNGQVAQVIDNNGLVINYSTSTNPQVVQQTSPKTGRGSGGGKKASDIPDICNKKSGYYIFAQEETQKLRLQNPNLSIVEVAKELTARWNRLDPTEKMVYEFRHQDLRSSDKKAQGHATTYTKPRPVYKSNKRRRDPNAPKQPLTAFFIYSTEERPKVKDDHPTMSVTDVAKELGRRWSELDSETKQRFHARADELRQKFDLEMAAYKQSNQHY